MSDTQILAIIARLRAEGDEAAAKEIEDVIKQRNWWYSHFHATADLLSDLKKRVREAIGDTKEPNK